MTSILLLLALVLAAVLAAVLLGRELVGWTWEDNPETPCDLMADDHYWKARDLMADDHYWKVRGPDGLPIALTEEQVEAAQKRARRIGWR